MRSPRQRYVANMSKELVPADFQGDRDRIRSVIGLQSTAIGEGNRTNASPDSGILIDLEAQPLPAIGTTSVSRTSSG